MAPKTERKKVREAIARAFSVESNDERVLQAADDIIEMIEHPQQDPAAPAANSFDAFSKNIQFLTQYSSMKLGDLVDEYTDDWVMDAIRVAVENNGLSLRYIEAVLKGWKANGKGWKPGQDKKPGRYNQKPEPKRGPAIRSLD